MAQAHRRASPVSPTRKAELRWPLSDVASRKSRLHDARLDIGIEHFERTRQSTSHLLDGCTTSRDHLATDSVVGKEEIDSARKHVAVAHQLGAAIGEQLLVGFPKILHVATGQHG